MSGTMRGRTNWSLTRDAEGHREYKLELLIKTDDFNDGPFTVLQTPGIYLPGAEWNVGNDHDPWAWCYPTCEITPVIVKEKGRHWKVGHTFGTKGPGFKFQRCQDYQIEDPLLEPAKVSGSFVNKSEEVHMDRFGLPIRTSSHEPLKGAAIEFDTGKPTIRIEQNVPILGLDVLANFINKVNDTPLWGMPARTIKLSSITWEKRYIGFCYAYYNRSLEFDVDENTFDRDVLDEGEKVLFGHWGLDSDGTDTWVLDNIQGVPPDPFNPSHFMKAVDRNGNPIHIILDGAGKPAYVSSGHFIAKRATIAAAGDGGTNYLVGDTITIIGGTFRTEAVVKVASINVHNEITSLSISNPGDYDSVPANKVDGVSNQDGLGAQITMEWERVRTGITAAGRIHIERYGEAYFPLLGIPLVF